MTDTPTVSVIIVNYNGKEHLGECFSSLSRLNYPRERLEVIMVDNASLDGSVEFVSTQFPWVRIVKNSNNLGFAKAINLGLRRPKENMAHF